MLAREEFTLQPGEAKIVRRPTVLRTILGSCAGVTFCAKRLGIGAMCHPMLPTRRLSGMTERDAPDRFVDLAIRRMLRELMKLGARRDEIEVKLFGCCDVLDFEEGRVTIGRMNAEMAVKVLADEGVQIAARQVGGPVGMYIYFMSDTGEVWLRRLSELDDRSKREQRDANGR